MCVQKHAPTHSLVVIPTWSDMQSNDHWDHCSYHTSWIDIAMSLNRTYINLRHNDYPVIYLLCVAHQHVGLAFKASSNPNSLYESETLSSKSARNSGKSYNPLYVNNSTAFVATRRSNWVILLHFQIDTSCIWFYQFSKASSESEDVELELCQPNFCQ